MLQKNINSSQTIFSLEDISLRYEEILALDGINLNIYRGEILFITGASGAGKTSLLRVLSGGLFPTKGKILFPNDFLQKHYEMTY